MIAPATIPISKVSEVTAVLPSLMNGNTMPKASAMTEPQTANFAKFTKSFWVCVEYPSCRTYNTYRITHSAQDAQAKERASPLMPILSQSNALKRILIPRASTVSNTGVLVLPST